MDRYLPTEYDPTLTKLAKQWVSKLEQSKTHKEQVYASNARECMQFYSGPRSWDELMGKDLVATDQWPETMFKIHINKAFEYVSLFGPSLYYDNAVRTVKPRAPLQVLPGFFADPRLFQQLAMEEQARVATDGLRSILVEAYLNWSPHEHRLERHSRLAVEEALIKGRGLLWTQLVESPDGAFRSVTSQWDSVDSLYVDPDATSLEKARWIARRVVHPTWQVERDYGLRPGSLKGNLESMNIQGDLLSDPDLQYDRKRGLTNDLIVYFQVWSKMGIGGRLPGMDYRLRGPLNELFGDYCYLVVAPSVPFPLNLPPDLVNAPGGFDKVLTATQWPIPFWAGRGDWWPVTHLDFFSLFNSPWPLPPLVAARGEMRFLNWVYSFIGGHVRNASRQFIAVKKSLPEEIKETILSGKDMEIMELQDSHGLIDEAIRFLQNPQLNGDIWKFVEAVEKAFDKRTGLTEMMYGGETETQARSATEVNLKNENMAVRPDDMARQVELWQSEVAAKEAVAARFLLSGEDVKLPLGSMASTAWNQWVYTDNLAEAAHQLEYRIEAGTTRRPNKEYAVRQMTEAMTSLFQPLLQYGMQTADLTPVNNLLSDFCKSRDLDPGRYELRMATPAPMLPSAAPANPTAQGQVAVQPASGDPALG
jgi:hypothetical protein